MKLFTPNTVVPQPTFYMFAKVHVVHYAHTAYHIQPAALRVGIRGEALRPPPIPRFCKSKLGLHTCKYTTLSLSL